MADAYLAAVAPRLDRIVAPGELAMCRSILAAVPAVAPRTYVFECPLDADAPRADFAFSLAAGAATLGWNLVHRLFAAPTRVPVSTYWLEFDLDGPAPLAPSVFVGDEHLAGVGAGAVIELLERLAPLDAAMRAAIDACHDALPRDASCFQVGRMLPRPGAPARLCIRNLPRLELAAYFGAVAPRVRVPAVARALLAMHHPYVLDLDIEPLRGVGDRIGLELVVDDPARCRELLGLLERFELGTPARRALVARWPGAAREVSHVKLVCEGGQIVGAKAYLALRFVDAPRSHLSHRGHRGS